ncbi:alpha/beta hydrolase [Corynebacterium anserum]|uniref:DUF1023 domain-containing protein n=1 Tax=Corynebacterium anserum TaxID=2684406 RepID=A0A7G7YLS8_9CORY|nr:alpha/beta hydrolase [Corynebacterium anserum]QNH95448.1 hypothetical protein GP473_00890 [Corynebacterium anserum]
MSTSVFDIEHAPVEQAAVAADEWSGVGKQVRTHAQRARTNARWTEDKQWEGAAADAASHRVDATINQADAMGLSIQGMGLTVGLYIRILEVARAAVSAATHAARAAHMSIEPTGLVKPRIAAGTGVAETAAMALSAVLKTAIAMVDALDTHTSTVLHAMSSTVGDAAESSSAYRHGEHLPARSPTHADAVRPTAEEPQGLTSGIHNSTPHGKDLSDVHIQKLDTPGGPVYIAGDVDTAETITTFVSGVGSSTSGSQHVMSTWAAEQVAEAKAQGKNTAVIAWHGYSAPDNVAAAISTEPARQGAQNLRVFQRQLREKNPHATLHVTGFSYGSVVVGEAATSDGPGLEANSIDFVGSPGVGARHTQDLTLLNRGKALGDPDIRSHHVPGDLIQLTTEAQYGVHGPDPSSPRFGARNSPESWSSYHWRRFLDFYILSRGDTNTHSSYPWDPSLHLAH